MASTSLRNFRISEEDTHRDNEPLLRSSHSNEHLGHVQHSRRSTDILPSAHLSVLMSIGLICVFIFVLLTVCFGVLFYKVNEENALNNWPAPSNSLYGEYLHGAVAADNIFCSEIGRNTLMKGGNAVDAAISTLTCIGVLNVHSAGLGGGHFMTLYNATTKKCHVIDARETAPASAYQDMYKDHTEKAQYGWKAIAVPGEVHGLWTAFNTFGSGALSWKELIQPTIDLMKSGYPTSQALARVLDKLKANITADPALKASFFNPQTNDVYKTGEIIKTRQNFIRTLEVLANASDPVNEFYKGDLMKEMVSEFLRNDGLLTADDFNAYESIVRKDEEVIYADLGSGIHACGPPPPSGAAATLALLNLLKKDLPTDTKTLEGNTHTLHKYLEASKFAYAKRSDFGDMNFANDALEIAKNITSNEWGEQTRKKITDHAHERSYYGAHFDFSDYGTSHVSIVDAEGNAVSVTSTINLYLGAQIISEATGIVWNNEMDDFSIPGKPNAFNIPPSKSNYIVANKRPQSSMSPIILFSDKMVMPIGAAGGSEIISSVAYATMHVLHLNRTIKQAIDFPRIHNQLVPEVTEVEDNFLPQLKTLLEDRGQTFQKSTKPSVVTAILHDMKNSKIYANSDFRKGPESNAAGY